MIAAALALVISIPSFAQEPDLDKIPEPSIEAAQTPAPAKAEAPAAASAAKPAAAQTSLPAPQGVKLDAAAAQPNAPVEQKVVVKDAVVQPAAAVPGMAAAAPAVIKAPVPAEPVADRAAPLETAKPVAPPAPAVFKPVGAAAAYTPVLEGYDAARKGFEDWLKDASAQAKDVDDRETALKKDIQAKDEELTQARFQNDKAKIRGIEQESKALWRQLDALGREKTKLAHKLAHDAADKVRELNAGVNQRLEDVGRQE